MSKTARCMKDFQTALSSDITAPLHEDLNDFFSKLSSKLLLLCKVEMGCQNSFMDDTCDSNSHPTIPACSVAGALSHGHRRSHKKNLWKLFTGGGLTVLYYSSYEKKL